MASSSERIETLPVARENLRDFVNRLEELKVQYGPFYVQLGESPSHSLGPVMLARPFTEQTRSIFLVVDPKRGYLGIRIKHETGRNYPGSDPNATYLGSNLVDSVTLMLRRAAVNGEPLPGHVSDDTRVGTTIHVGNAIYCQFKGALTSVFRANKDDASKILAESLKFARSVKSEDIFKEEQEITRTLQDILNNPTGSEPDSEVSP